MKKFKYYFIDFLKLLGKRKLVKSFRLLTLNIKYITANEAYTCILEILTLIS